MDNIQIKRSRVDTIYIIILYRSIPFLSLSTGGGTNEKKQSKEQQERKVNGEENWSCRVSSQIDASRVDRLQEDCKAFGSRRINGPNSILSNGLISHSFFSFLPMEVTP